MIQFWKKALEERIYMHHLSPPTKGTASARKQKLYSVHFTHYPRLHLVYTILLIIIQASCHVFDLKMQEYNKPIPCMY